VRTVALAVALALCVPVWAQDKAPKTQDKAPKKKQGKQAAHKKASPEQIRKFDELQKKQAK
jgi:hypothetical protein